ncbi:MAG: MATE family efflux transporter [Sphingomonadales bacterium]
MTSHTHADQTAPKQRLYFAAVARTWSLAWPVFLMNLVVIGMSTVDVVMVGRAGTEELAYLGIGRVMFWLAIVICSGLFTGVTVFTANADGAGEREKAGDIFRQGIAYTAVLALFWTPVLLFAGEAVLRALALPEALVAEGGDYIRFTAIGLPLQLYIVCCFLWLEGISRPRPGLIVMLATLPANAGLNWLLIYGNWGFPEMGASGAAIATTLAQGSGAVLIYAYLRGMHERELWGLAQLWPRDWRAAWRDGKALRHFGYAPGFATGMEFLGFNALNIMTGYLGVVVVSAYQVVFSLHAISFAAAMGFASATAVRVGNAMGRQDPAAVGFQVRLSAGMTILAMLPFTCAYLLAPEFFLSIFGAEPDVVVTSVMLLAIIAPFLIFDGLQYMLVYALRAAGDQVVASVLQVSSFLIVMGGGGALFTFARGMGAPGIAWGMVAGMVCAALLLWPRFMLVQRRLSK